MKNETVCEWHTKNKSNKTKHQKLSVPMINILLLYVECRIYCVAIFRILFCLRFWFDCQNLYYLAFDNFFFLSFISILKALRIKTLVKSGQSFDFECWNVILFTFCCLITTYYCLLCLFPFGCKMENEPVDSKALR